jgi:hypothetical protein
MEAIHGDFANQFGNQKTDVLGNSFPYHAELIC